MYSSIFRRAFQLVENGITVKYINIFLPQENLADYNIAETAGLNGDMNDTSYWESTCTHLGDYGSYRFLYIESAVGIETSQVTPGNLTATMNWSTIMQQTIAMLADVLVENVVYETVTTASSILSILLSGYQSPLSISYGESSGYFRTLISGDVYLRTVFIRDELDRISGHAYYEWGHTERLVAALRAIMKYPISRNASGTYEFAYPSETSAIRVSKTPGYDGNGSLYARLIELYSNTAGYFTHVETIDIESRLRAMLQ